MLLTAVLTAALAVSAVVAASVEARAASSEDASVVRVVDGDTVDVRRDGELVRVRLLNIDTPETVDPSRPVECLGPEASAYLAQLLPSGQAVTLEYDQEREDRYGRTLAALVLPSGAVVNEEVARAGLADVLVVGDNDRFAGRVESARAEAEQAQRGLYAPDTACMPQARVETLQSQAAQASSPPPGTADFEQLAQHHAQLAALYAAASALDVEAGAAVPGVPFRGLDPSALRTLRSAAADAGWVAREGRSRAAAPLAAARTAAVAAAQAAAEAAEQQRLEAERVEAERVEAERVEAERLAAEQAEAARRAAEQQAAAERAAEEAEQERRAAEQRAAQQRQQQPAPQRTSSPQRSAAPDPAPAPRPTTGGGGDGGYTGCRSYAPGGRSWSPIPCP